MAPGLPEATSNSAVRRVIAPMFDTVPGATIRN
jgi:hypothetical protein